MSSLFAPSNAPMPGETEADRWHKQAEADYAICRVLADRWDARLERTPAARRVGWEKAGCAAYGILIPDPLPRLERQDDWYLYHVWGERLLRRSQAERAERRMIILAESVDDWAELLRQAIRHLVVDARYEITPDYTDALGETEDVPDGFRFRIFAHAPGAVRPSDLTVTGRGKSPQAAARDACRRWLDEQTPVDAA